MMEAALREAIVSGVRSHVTVNARISEIEHLVWSYCLTKYPSRIQLPVGARDLCVDEEGLIIVRQKGNDMTVLSDDGVPLRQSGSLFGCSAAVTWVVYHPKLRKLLVAVQVAYQFVQLVTVDPQTWCVRPWIDTGSADRPRVFLDVESPEIHFHSGRVAIVQRVRGTPGVVNRMSMFDAGGHEIMQHAFSTWCPRALDIGDGRVLICRATGDAFVLNKDGTQQETGMAVPGGPFCYDPVSRHVVVLSGNGFDSSLHFMDTQTWTSKEVTLKLRQYTAWSKQIVLRISSDGVRLLYVRNDDVLFVFDLASFDPQ